MRFLSLVLLAGGCAVHPAGSTGGDAGSSRITNDGNGTYTMTLDRFTVAPGQERYACQDFANPFGGDAAGIRQFASQMTPGSHHLLLFYKTGATDGALADCSGTEFAAGPYGSQRPDDQIAYPPGVAAVIAPSDGFRVQVHYLNASPSPTEVSVELRLTRAADGTVRDHAAILFFDNMQIDVPAGATGVVVQKTCTLPFAANLVQATGHMHQHGRRFQAVAAGQTIFDSSSFSDVTPALFDPPLALPAGTAVTFSCTYDNDGAAPIGYGDSARTNEMCIFSAQFFPAPFGGWTCF